MKEFFLTDREIQDLIVEPKTMDCTAGSLLRGMKVKRGRENPFDFSCGLGFIPKGRTQVFTLIRYNGKSHQHTNRLENESSFYDFHIHQATEKYQKSSYGDEHYARRTNLYTDLYGALNNLLSDCKVTSISSDDRQMRLFE